MSIPGMFPEMRISASGLAAEKKRMEISANNIANAHQSGASAAETYRRQQVIFASSGDAPADINPPAGELLGVTVLGVIADQSELPQVFDPGHPYANAQGFVTMPNVSIPIEMIDMMTASRAYEANLKALQLQRQMVEQSLSLLRG